MSPRPVFCSTPCVPVGGAVPALWGEKENCDAAPLRAAVEVPRRKSGDCMAQRHPQTPWDRMAQAGKSSLQEAGVTDSPFMGICVWVCLPSLSKHTECYRVCESCLVFTEWCAYLDLANWSSDKIVLTKPQQALCHFGRIFQVLVSPTAPSSCHSLWDYFRAPARPGKHFNL